MNQPSGGERITFIMSAGNFRELNYMIGETVHPDGFIPLMETDPALALQALEASPRAVVDVSALTVAGEVTDRSQPLQVELIVKQSLVDRVRRRKVGKYLFFTVNSIDQTI